LKKGAQVVYNAIEEVHVSGHACQEELKIIHNLVKPEFFIPVHGEYRHLRMHAMLAEEMGMDPKNIFIMATGEVLELCSGNSKKSGKVTTGSIMIDGLGIGDVGNIVLRDRKHLSQDGIITVVVTIDKASFTILSGPDIITRGFVYERESKDLLSEATEVVRVEIDKCMDKKVTEWSVIKSNIKYALGDFLYSKKRRRPIILSVIIEI